MYLATLLDFHGAKKVQVLFCFVFKHGSNIHLRFRHVILFKIHIQYKLS